MAHHYDKSIGMSKFLHAFINYDITSDHLPTYQIKTYGSEKKNGIPQKSFKVLRTPYALMLIRLNITAKILICFHCIVGEHNKLRLDIRQKIYQLFFVQNLKKG